MFYWIRANNSTPIYAYASNHEDIERYVDWLNRDRATDFYHAMDFSDEDWIACGFPRSKGVLSCDTPGWDHFMSEDA